MARALKKVFKVNNQIEQEQWDVHYDKERKRRQAVEASLEHRRAAGETVEPVVETSITTWGQWQAKDSAGQLITWSDYDEA